MSAFPRFSSVRRTFLALLPGAALAQVLPGQSDPSQPGLYSNPNTGETRLPNGKLQRDEILKADYEQNLKDARELMNLSKSFEYDLEKSDRFVLSLDLLKKLDDMEKITKRIRGRMRH